MIVQHVNDIFGGRSDLDRLLQLIVEVIGGADFPARYFGDQFRKLVLNAIVWTAKIDVPAAGVRSRPLTVRDLEANQDYKKPGNYNPLRIERMLGQWNGAASE